MNSYDIKCPECGRFIVKSNLMNSRGGLLCTKCKIRFDVVVDSDSSKTGFYVCTNVRPA